MYVLRLVGLVILMVIVLIVVFIGSSLVYVDIDIG